MTQLIVIVCYLALLLLLGFFASRLSRGTSSDYMLASHSIGPVLLLMSLFGTTMTAFALVGSTGVSFRQGVGIYGELASAAGIMHSLCFFLIGIPLWKIGRRNGFRTQIQYFRTRFDSQLLGYLLFPLLIGFVVTYLLGGVVAAGAVINTVTKDAFANAGWFESAGFGVPSQLASGVICLVVLTYVFFGGMRGTAWANTFQTGFFMVLGLVTFFTIANSMGGKDSFFENLQVVSQSVPKAKMSMANMKWSVFMSYLLIPLSVGMFPHVFQHWLTAKSAKTFRLPIVMHPIMVLIVWAPCVLIGVWAASPLSGIDPAKIGTNDVLAVMVNNHTTDLLGGLLTAGILAAIMSSLDSQFLCLGTMFTEDIVRPATSGKLSDKQTIWYARTFIIAIVAITFVLSMILPRSIFELGIWSFSGFTGLFPIVVAAIYWRRATSSGAIASVIVTAVLWIVLFKQSGFGANKGYTFPEEPFSLGLFDIPVMNPIAAITAASTITLIVVSLMTKPPSEQTVGKFFPTAK
ncbi:sodium:solute symporter family protein [bacterium]|nr:sodium:solute symporter family protein [bacterium]